MSDYVSGFISGLIVATVLVLFWALDVNSIPAQARKAIEQCEMGLPRTQHCIVTAVPEEKP